MLLGRHTDIWEAKIRMHFTKSQQCEYCSSTFPVCWPLLLLEREPDIGPAYFPTHLGLLLGSIRPAIEDSSCDHMLIRKLRVHRRLGGQLKREIVAYHAMRVCVHALSGTVNLMLAPFPFSFFAHGSASLCFVEAIPSP